MFKILVPLFSLVVLTTNVFSQGFNELVKKVAISPQTADKYGFSVAIDGHFAVVGAPGQALDVNESNSAFNAGAAYILERDAQGNWNTVQKIVNSDRAAYDYFGASVAIEGSKIVVGAWGNCFDELGNDSIFRAGAVYVFERNGMGIWNQTQKLVETDRHEFDYFGKSVDLSGDYIIGGAFGNDYDVTVGNYFLDAGAAFLYRWNGSSYVNHQKIVSNDRGFHDDFGEKVAIDGNVVVVGARFDNDDELGANPISSAGSAYIFEKDGANNWNQVKKSVASDRALTAQYGYDVAVEGNTVLISAKDEDFDANGVNFFDNAGAVYIVEKSGSIWSETQKIVASDRDADDFFGFSVDISNGIIIASASHDEHNATGGNPVLLAGSAYIFRKVGATWTQTQKIVHSDRAVEDHFGVEVSISGGYMLLGADLKDGFNLQNNPITVSGAAYFFNECLDNTGQFSATACGSYDWNGTNYSTSGTYYQTLVNYYGCDSIVELNLTINPLPNVNGGNDVAVCTGNSVTLTATGALNYSWSGGITNSVAFTPSATTAYIVTGIDALGCQKSDTVLVEVLPIPSINIQPVGVALCENEAGLFTSILTDVSTSYSVEWFYNGNSLGIENDTLSIPNLINGASLAAQLSNSLGCITTVTSPLVTTLVNNVDTVSVTFSICSNETVTVGGTVLSTAGVHTVVTTSSLGCDSVIIATVNVIPAYFSTSNISICEGDFYTFGPNNLNISGTYTQLFTNQFGCDSTITLNLNVVPNEYEQDLILCNGTTYIFGSQTISSAGLYDELFVTALGCDSLVHLTVTTGSTYTINIETSICENSQFVLGSQILTTAGTFSETFTSILGCDSTVNVILTINMIDTSYVYETICSGTFYPFGSQNPTNTGSYVETFENQLGCDSVVLLELFVTPAPISTQSVNLCVGESYLFGSQTITQSGVYSINVPTNGGCDSLVVLSALFYSPTFQSVTEVICPTDSLLFDGNYLNIPGNYVATFPSIFGCDSTVTLTLQHETAPTIGFFGSLLWISSGQSFVWYQDGVLLDGEVYQGYTPLTDGLYTVDVYTASGCTHTISYTMQGLSTRIKESFNVRLYPNPTLDIINIEASTNLQVELYNGIGELVNNLQLVGGKDVLDLSNLPQGTYFIKLINEIGEFSFKKVVKL
jgi:hypothetical protein